MAYFVLTSPLSLMVLRRQSSHSALYGKHPLDTGPVQASLSRGFSSLQRLFPLDFVILIIWASFQCQQKSIHSSGRSHQSNGNELFKGPCHGHKLWGNIGTLFLQCTMYDLLAVWNVNILLCSSFLVSFSTWRNLWVGAGCCTFCENPIEPCQMSMCESEHVSRIHDCSLHTLTPPRRLRCVCLKGTKFNLAFSVRWQDHIVYGWL